MQPQGQDCSGSCQRLYQDLRHIKVSLRRCVRSAVASTHRLYPSSLRIISSFGFFARPGMVGHSSSRGTHCLPLDGPDWLNRPGALGHWGSAPSQRLSAGQAWPGTWPLCLPGRGFLSPKYSIILPVTNCFLIPTTRAILIACRHISPLPSTSPSIGSVCSHAVDTCDNNGFINEEIGHSVLCGAFYSLASLTITSARWPRHRRGRAVVSSHCGSQRCAANSFR